MQPLGVCALVPKLLMLLVSLGVREVVIRGGDLWVELLGLRVMLALLGGEEVLELRGG